MYVYIFPSTGSFRWGSGLYRLVSVRFIFLNNTSNAVPSTISADRFGYSSIHGGGDRHTHRSGRVSRLAGTHTHTIPATYRSAPVNTISEVNKKTTWVVRTVAFSETQQQSDYFTMSQRNWKGQKKKKRRVYLIRTLRAHHCTDRKRRHFVCFFFE